MYALKFASVSCIGLEEMLLAFFLAFGIPNALFEGGSKLVYLI